MCGVGLLVGDGRCVQCTWDSSDIPSQYFESLRDRSEYIRDYDANFAQDVDAGKLGALSYVKPLGYKTEHPGSGTTITAGATFVQSVVDKIAASQKYQNNTLVIWTYDEGGGFFDHIVPPPTNPHDGQPYGVRIPTMAIGYFAKKNYGIEIARPRCSDPVAKSGH